MADYLRESGVKWLWERIKTLLSAKQDKLVSGTNIKTINGESILGSGDVSISGGSGGGDFDSSGTYPNLIAGKATKLATARKIGITGGAVGTATNFDGSSAINIPVTKIDESFITWTTASKRAHGSVTDNIMKNGQQNSFAFMPPNAVTVEYTNDSGATWLDYGLTDDEKTMFLTPLVGSKILKVGKDGADLADTAQLRITLDFIEARMQLELRKITLCVQTFSGTANGSVRIKILSELYENYDADIWDEFIDEDVRSPGWMSLPVTDRTNATWGYKGSGTAYPAKLRVIFYRTGTPRYNTTLINMVGLSNHVQKGNDIAKYCWPCTMDVSQNATFPNAIKGKKLITDGGTSNQVLLGDGSLIPLSELSPITDADAEILLDNHIHSINVNANGNDVNINVIESSKNGNTWETEDNDITIPLATTTSAGMMSKEDKIKSDGLLIYYHLTEDEYTNHELVSLYSLVLAIKDELFDSTTNKWKYDDSKSYDVRVKGWTLQDNGITYLNVNVRLLTSQGGHSIGFSGFADVDFITETYFDAIIPLYIGYICGKYHIEDDGMTVVAPEDSGFYIEI